MLWNIFRKVVTVTKSVADKIDVNKVVKRLDWIEAAAIVNWVKLQKKLKKAVSKIQK
jgi:hypothetical protein